MASSTGKHPDSGLQEADGQGHHREERDSTFAKGLAATLPAVARHRRAISCALPEGIRKARVAGRHSLCAVAPPGGPREDQPIMQGARVSTAAVSKKIIHCAKRMFYSQPIIF
jgi:hypothetical protein